MLPQLHHFWDMFQTELADKSLYMASIREMRLKLAELQESDTEAQKIRVEELKKGLGKYVDVNRVLHYQKLLFVPEIIQTKPISQHHDNPLASHFGINKIKELIGRKYDWLSLRKGVEAYVRGCNICLALKAVRNKPYDDLQALLILTHQWEDLTKMVYYKPIKVTINAPGLVEVTLDVLIQHHDLSNLIVFDKGLLFTSKFWPHAFQVELWIPSPDVL